MAKDNITIGELAKKYPNKTYRELEQEKAQRDLVEHLEAALPPKEGTCITAALKKDRGIGHNNPPAEKEIDYHRYWKDMYEKEHKLRQEAEGETTIVKGIGMSSPEMKDLRARVKELDNSLAIALEINESHQRYNGKLQTRITELEEENNKLIVDRLDRTRKAGL